ncbi:hypothetical protein L6R50_09920 [Myxococcota bacterium]|nr:hypothetical protein [Myxococcota bacterium]
MASDDADQPSLDLYLSGEGVVPAVAVEPSLLYFPTGLAGPQTQEVRISSEGSGPLTVLAVGPDAGDPAFGVDLPEAVLLPFVLEPGLILTVSVTFEAGDGVSHSDRLLVESDDPDEEDALWPVDLVAAGEPPDGSPQPPLVEIVSPADGAAVHAAAETLLVGQVADPDDPPDQLAVLWYSDLDGWIGSGGADPGGRVDLPVTGLSSGTHTITLVARDPAGGEGSDSARIFVWDDDDELAYTLSGGETAWHFWHVDDDVRVYVDGTEVLRDDDGHQDTHAPLEFTARRGATLRVVASDSQWCTKALDALFLHFEGGAMQVLNDEISVSACTDHPDYDPDYEGPWPSTFLDQSWEIAIP